MTKHTPMSELPPSVFAGARGKGKGKDASKLTQGRYSIDIYRAYSIALDGGDMSEAVKEATPAPRFRKRQVKKRRCPSRDWGKSGYQGQSTESTERKGQSGCQQGKTQKAKAKGKGKEHSDTTVGKGKKGHGKGHSTTSPAGRGRGRGRH